MTKNNNAKTKSVRKNNVSMISWKLYRATKNRKYIRRNNND